jgi:hypothetical protein
MRPGVGGVAVQVEALDGVVMVEAPTLVDVDALEVDQTRPVSTDRIER